MKKLPLFEKDEYKRLDKKPLSDSDRKLIREICDAYDAEIFGAIQDSRSLEDFMMGFFSGRQSMELEMNGFVECNESSKKRQQNQK